MVTYIVHKHAYHIHRWIFTKIKNHACGRPFDVRACEGVCVNVLGLGVFIYVPDVCVAMLLLLLVINLFLLWFISFFVFNFPVSSACFNEKLNNLYQVNLINIKQYNM